MKVDAELPEVDVVLILGFDDYWQGAKALANELTLPCSKVAVHHFPDGESKVTLPVDLPPAVIVCRSLHRPNEKLLELILVAETARAMGVKRLLLVAPYLCYMRQDIAFHPGEAVSQKIIGGLLAQYFDDVITVDPHLQANLNLMIIKTLLLGNIKLPIIHRGNSADPLPGFFIRPDDHRIGKILSQVLRHRLSGL